MFWVWWCMRCLKEFFYSVCFWSLVINFVSLPNWKIYWSKAESSFYAATNCWLWRRKYWISEASTDMATSHRLRSYLMLLWHIKDLLWMSTNVPYSNNGNWAWHLRGPTISGWKRVVSQKQNLHEIKQHENDFNTIIFTTIKPTNYYFSVMRNFKCMALLPCSSIVLFNLPKRGAEPRVLVERWSQRRSTGSPSSFIIKKFRKLPSKYSIEQQSFNTRVNPLSKNRQTIRLSSTPGHSLLVYIWWPAQYSGILVRNICLSALVISVASPLSIPPKLIRPLLTRHLWWLLQVIDKRWRIINDTADGFEFIPFQGIRLEQLRCKKHHGSR